MKESRVRRRASRIIGALSLATFCHGTAGAAEQTGAPPLAQAAKAQRTDAEQHAIERARHALETKREWIDGLDVESVTESQWSDSSLGCRKPGLSYMQVITSGYTVTFTGKDARKEVHVAGDNAVVCDSMLRGTLKTRQGQARVPLRELDSMITAARTDLSTRIGAKPEEVKLLGWTPLRLPARVLRCEASSAEGEPAVPGYRISLDNKGRAYTYQSDMKSVYPCPPIEHN